MGSRLRILDDTAAIVAGLADALAPGDQVVIMSNGGFDDIHDRLLAALRVS